MSVAVIVPWRDTDPYRNVVCEVIVDHYRNELPVDELLLVDADGPTFNRGRALNNGVARSTSDVLVFADADTLVPGANLRAAVDFARDVSYVVPFDGLVGLDEASTVDVMRGVQPPFIDWRVEQPEHVALDWPRPSDGGVNVCTRESFEKCGGFDPRFVGWGYEDAAFSIAMHTLVGSPMWLSATAVHLWHPVDPSRHDAELQAAQLSLCQRYELAAGSVPRVSAIIDERTVSA